ncbi:MAG TPA: Stk1 family PASTA domain-containing Ser/Thr kinase [Solirubrobacteraceae bacterium]|jgi:serine/threonine-protein kinase|nr:Stk1 family PASTA domain-containing Ser/Thr kinase [Solirubrobacteraceae bacterium]
MTFQITPGTLIDERYQVVTRVGSGGMAEVYCVEDIQLGRRVALKLLHERFAADSEFVERFRREASSAASLSHANIVNVYDRGEWGGTYYIAMEFLDGRSLDAIVREEAPLAPERAIEITEQVLRAARFAHRRNVVHRDLKPHNVILDEEGRVKVTDFGIARAGASEITQTGSIMGTARYLSPEQAQGNAVGPASDLYAIGIMLYELLTGAVPFEGESVVAIALRHLSEPPRPPSQLVPSISPSLDAIVMRALEKAPERRFADADEFLAALEHERERLRREDGAHTAALEPIAPIAVLPAQPPYQHPASYTTQQIGPIGPATGAYGPGAYWDPNTTGIIPPGAILLPPGGQRRNAWPWILLGLIAVAAAAAAIAYALTRNHTAQVPIPRVVGLTKTVAQAQIGNAGLNSIVSLVYSKHHPKGDVVSEIPASGHKLAKGSTVTLNVSKGPAPPASVQIPTVVNENAAVATHALHHAGFKVTAVKQASTTVPRNTVISTNPAAGSSRPRGSTIVMYFSSGPPRVGVPSVVGQTLTEAEALLQQRNFVPLVKHQASTTEPPGTVLSQSPTGGRAAQGSKVTIVVAKAPARVNIPHLTGETEAAASARLGKLGLVPQIVPVTRSVHPAYDGLVLSSLPAAGSTAAPGSVVELRVEHYVAPVGPTGPTGPTGAT